jgi:hypothetical protein
MSDITWPCVHRTTPAITTTPYGEGTYLEASHWVEVIKWHIYYNREETNIA